MKTAILGESDVDLKKRQRRAAMLGRLGIIGRKTLKTTMMKKRRRRAGAILGGSDVDEKKKKIMKKKAGESVRFSLPDDLAYELLARMPVKELFKLRCVAKSWYSMIYCPRFTVGHRFHNPKAGLLISLPLEDLPPAPTQYHFYYSALGGGGGGEEDPRPKNFRCRLKFPSSSPSAAAAEWDGVTAVINGLVCFYSRIRSCICNVSTGEVMNLPQSGFFENAVYTNYHLGFDHVNRVYKLLKISIVNRCSFGQDLTSVSEHTFEYSLKYGCECEILILGRDTRWRKLDSNAIWSKNDDWSAFNKDPPANFMDQGFLCNGVLYWKIFLSGAMYMWLLISFDLSKEEFGFLHPPRWGDVWFCHNFPPDKCKLTQFNGCLAIFCVDDSESISIYSLHDDDDDDDDDDDNGGGGSDDDHYDDYEGGYKWIRHTISLPTDLMIPRCPPLPIGNLPTGEILIANHLP